MHIYENLHQISKYTSSMESQINNDAAINQV